MTLFHKKRSGVTLVELMVSIFISTYIFLCAWSIYMMGWKWWYEIAPQSECQRIARIAVSMVSEGLVDTSSGVDTIDFVSYRRRIGSEGASRTYADVLNTSFITPTITSNGNRINFKLESDPTASNVRSFYLGQDANGIKAVYYQYNNGTPKIVNGTKGITNLTFEPVGGYTNLYKITATVQKTVMGSRQVPYQVSVTYSDYVYLRNI